MLNLFRRQLGETWSILKSFKGNARGCLIAEPFWGIPYNLYIGYASVYMVALGCNDLQVGLITSISLALQAFFALISGYVTDRLGRKRTSLVFDVLGWSIATLVWAFAQNFYYFLAAGIINSCFRIVHTSWSCLMIEDTEPHDRVNVFTWISVAGLLAGFFAPITGFLIGEFQLVPTMRGLYLLAFASMTFMFYLRNALTTETRMGLIKMEETRNHRLRDVMDEYLRIIIHLFKNPYTIVASLLMIFNNIQVTIKSTFLAILLTEGLRFPVEAIAVFPAVNSGVMLIFFLFVMPSVKGMKPGKPLIFGYLISIVSNLLLVLSPDNNFAVVFLSTIMGGIGTAVMYPFTETIVANSIKDEDRAKISSILYTLLFAVSAPFGYIGGYLSSISERLPFVLMIIVFVSGILVVWILDRMEKNREAGLQNPCCEQ